MNYDRIMPALLLLAIAFMFRGCGAATSPPPGGNYGDVVEHGVNQVNQQYDDMKLPTACTSQGGCAEGELPTRPNYRCEAWHANNGHLPYSQCPHHQ